MKKIVFLLEGQKFYVCFMIKRYLLFFVDLEYASWKNDRKKWIFKYGLELEIINILFIPLECEWLIMEIFFNWN